MNLIILTTEDSAGDHLYRLSDHRAEHIRSVLKLNAGDSLEAGLLNGPQGTAHIESCDEHGVVIRADELKVIKSPAPPIDIICALPRPQTVKKVLSTAAMMGVRALYLVRASRVEKSYFHSPLLESGNYLPYLLEGLSQGKLTRLPEVTIHNKFRQFFEDTLSELYTDSSGERILRLLPDMEAGKTLFEVCPKPIDKDTSLLIAIGPEGGWVPFEVDLMEAIGFKRFSLGRWTLRVEHAVTAVLSQLELLRVRSEQQT